MAIVHSAVMGDLLGEGWTPMRRECGVVAAFVGVARLSNACIASFDIQCA